jgi:hypothetical protein
MPSLSPSDLWRFARARHTWLIPSILVLALAMVFPLIYLSATSAPEDDLHGLPIALVTEVQSPATDPAFAPQVASAIEDAIDADTIAVRVMTSAQLETAMDDDRVAGAIIIPPDFDASLTALLVRPDASTTLPVVQIRTNAGDGGISGGLVTGNLTPVLEAISAATGEQLIAQATAAGQELSGAHTLLLHHPFTVSDAPYRELPSRAGFGTSAFYLALVLVLLGFIGASVLNPSIDSALGFAPAELGPLVARRPYRPASRLQTLLLKWGLLVVLSPLASALVVGVVVLIGIPVADPAQTWLFGSASVAAIGLGALTVFAIFGGGIGALVNTTFFIALAMTSSGGTVPVSATPPFFAWLSSISPFHAVIEGTRSLLYFDGNPSAGLADGWMHLGIGALVAVALGVTATVIYARRRMFTRHPRPAAPAVA